MKQLHLTAAVGGLLLAAAGPIGAQVYKGVDENGNVVYSASPFGTMDPDQVETLRIDPGPTEADRSAAERRAQALLPPAGGGVGLTGPDAPQPQPPAPEASAQKRSPSIDWQEDEAVQRAGVTGRAQRGAGGLSGEQRGRSGASLPSERSSR
jgi:hypothetical protein